MLKNLMYVTVYVSDQDRALAFYTDTLDWRCVPTTQLLGGAS